MVSVHTVPVRSPSDAIGKVGFVLLCAFNLSGFANDWCLRLFGTKAYVSTITVLLLPLAWLLSGRPLAGLRSKVGVLWAMFLAWLILAAPFSVWRSGSAAMLANYVPRAYLNFFYITAFVTSLRRCRQWMYLQIAGGAALLLTCAVFGSTGEDPADARFRIPDSLFFGNANELALALLIAVCSFLFLLHHHRILVRAAGIAGIAAASWYAFRTGSRGGIIAACAMILCLFLISRRKMKFAAVGLVCLGLALAAGLGIQSSPTLHRLSLLTGSSSPTEAESDLSSLASQQEREELFKSSLRYTLAHPLLGVGPDQFATAVNDDAERTGEHIAWLGTHNTYTQVSSECGVPALMFYVGVIVLCLRSNIRLHRKTRGRPDYQGIAALSKCLLAATVVYAASAIFFHMAYSAYLPTIAGCTVALQRLAQKPRRSDRQRRAAYGT